MNYFKSSDGVKLAYEDEGAGVALICLAGLTRNGSDFDHVAEHLDGLRIIRPDYRGRGASEHADPATYNVPTEGRDVLELMDHLGLEKAAILGTSRGGIIAMGLAAVAKHRLLGVCLNDIGPELDPQGLRFIMTYLGRRPAQKTYEEAAQARAEFMTGFSGVPMARWREEVRKYYVRDARGLAINYDPKLRGAVEAASKAAPVDMWPFFDALGGLPLALIRGANSDLLAMRTVEEMRHRRPDMLFANVPDRGHVPFLDEAESLEVLHKFEDLIR